MKQSQIKRLIPKKQAAALVREDADSDALRAAMQRDGATTIAKMRGKGFELVTCLDTGEGVFVREHKVVGLHVQLPTPLYKKLEREVKSRGISKRELVVDALEKYLESEK